MADDDANTVKQFTDEGIVNEVCGKSDLQESDDYDDETLEPVSTNMLAVHQQPFRQLVYTPGFGEKHAATLNKLEAILIPFSHEI